MTTIVINQHRHARVAVCALIMYCASIVGLAPVVVPREALGSVDRRGRAPVSDEDLSSVAASLDVDAQVSVSSASADTSESLTSVSDPDACPAWALEWRCSCYLLKELALRARAASLRSTLRSLSRDHRRQHVWAELCKLHEPRRRPRFALFPRSSIRRRSWRRAMAVGQTALEAMQRSLMEGAFGPPANARRMNI